jgi:hypothetical protein
VKSKRVGNCFTTTVYPIDRDGAEHEIDVRVHYDCDYEPAKVSGPPESCYPASGEMVITEIEILHDLPEMLSPSEAYACAEDSMDRLTEEAWESYNMLGADDAA